MKCKVVFLLFSLGMILLAGCEKAIDLKIPVDPPQLTMDVRVIAGHDSVAALVGISTYSLSADEPDSPDDAEVFLYEDDQLVGQMFPQRRDGFFGRPTTIYYYTLDFRPQPGRTYKVEARHPDFATISGQDFVPAQVELDSVVMTFPDNSFQPEVSIYFTDLPGAGDFYQIKGIYQSFYIDGNNDTIVFQSIVSFNTQDQLLEIFGEFEDPFGGSTERYGEIGYLTDDAFDGRQRKLVVRPQYGGLVDSNETFFVELTHITEDYYRHEKSKASNFDSDNPFTEPVSLYGNIRNGYGIVAGGAVSRKEVEF